jgi:hypothetical protein
MTPELKAKWERNLEVGAGIFLTWEEATEIQAELAAVRGGVVLEGKCLVDAGALAVLEEKLNMARRWGYGTRHQWRHCRTESVFPNGMADLVPMIDALRSSQHPGQGGKGGDHA